MKYSVKTVAAVAAGLRTACLGVLLLLSGVQLALAQTCGKTTWTLWAGQTINAGTLTVENDQTNIYVTYALNTAAHPNANFGQLHLWVGNDLTNLPKNGPGVPIPGQFPYKVDASGKTTYTFVIPFTDVKVQDVTKACPLQLYVVAHAEVDLDGDGENNETAFGGDQPGSGPRWWFYAQYNVCCDIPPPPVIEKCATAFGYGTHIFSTETKSNPDGLPSLKLIKNRWGWALRLTAPGNYVNTLWAGAGLNDTSKGKNAGTVNVNWDGSVATVTYNTANGYTLKEIHIYAADEKPTTTAPGQYGYGVYFDPPVTTHTKSFVLEDLDGYNGVWLIAHAVVCK